METRILYYKEQTAGWLPLSSVGGEKKRVKEIATALFSPPTS
jgi:hypothetical protein